SLARRAVRDGVGALGARDLGLALGDQRTRDGRAEKVLALVDGAGAEHRKDEVAHELLAQILDDALHRAGGARPGVETVELLGLAAVDEPAQDDRRVEAAGVGEHDAAHGGAHDTVALLAHGTGANQKAGRARRVRLRRATPRRSSLTVAPRGRYLSTRYCAQY